MDFIENKKGARSQKTGHPDFEYCYSEIASAGHVPAHVPQLMHLSASIVRLSPFSEIAETGQSDSQAPQFTHLSASIL